VLKIESRIQSECLSSRGNRFLWLAQHVVIERKKCGWQHRKRIDYGGFIQGLHGFFHVENHVVFAQPELVGESIRRQLNGLVQILKRAFVPFMQTCVTAGRPRFGQLVI